MPYTFDLIYRLIVSFSTDQKEYISMAPSKQWE